MQREDYGIIDSLTSEMRQAIDLAIIGFASLRPRKVAAVVREILEKSPAAIPGLPDWFYMDRIGELIDDGVLVVVTEGEDPRYDCVKAALGPSVGQ